MKPKKSCKAGILNLAKYTEEGTHWTAWYKHKKNRICYFDSFGDLPPPSEFLKFAANCEIYYNVDREQSYNSVICGQLYLCFLFQEHVMSDMKHFFE